MGKRSCFVPGCSTGYPAAKKTDKLSGVKGKSLFKANSEVQLRKWRHAIPRKDKVLRIEDSVCELHFLPEDIDRFYETTLSDGRVDRLERGRPSLRPDAVPRIFPNLPQYLTKLPRQRKPPTARQATETSFVEYPSEENVEQGNLNLLADLAIRRIPTVLPSCGEADFNVQILSESLKLITLPSPSWTSALVGSSVVFLEVGTNYISQKSFVIAEDLSFKVIIMRQEVTIEGLKEIVCLNDVVENIRVIDGLLVCQGIPEDSRVQLNCSGYIPTSTEGQDKSKCWRPPIRCPHCNLRKKALDQKERRTHTLTTRRKKVVAALRTCRLKSARLAAQVQKNKRQMRELMAKCSASPLDILEDFVCRLPSCQQEAVRACFSASKKCNSKGRRYTRDWVYECILLRIKSRKAYEHIRAHNILALPSIETLRSYLERVKGAYGFQEATFRCLKEKGSQLSPEERRGALLLDEMKLAPSLAFDKKSLKVYGFTDLGGYTPAHQRGQRGDHALVLMYQPFRGKWVQALSCFLSRGCASSTVLQHLILDCITLLENAGFFVDLVVTDGAQWNRSMWKHFSINSHNVSCSHPYDPSRRLWFTSDFPHLVKNVRNFFVQNPEILTPDGLVKLRHWEAILEVDDPCGYQLQACPQLTMDHIHPKPYQKMNVRRAFQFFGAKVAETMNLFRGRHQDLEDCEPSVKLIERFQRLISSLNSRIPAQALRKGSKEWEALEKFITYLEEWESLATSKGKPFLSSNTSLGLKVSIRTTMELHQFLEAECGFQYLMTARLNQDALERFFGMMRSACGSNDHPDSILFMRMFKLISTYSLVKPPRGSNISGGDMLESLMSVNDIGDVEHRKERLESILDELLEKGNYEEGIPRVLEADHNYQVNQTTDYIINYFSGYVARKSVRFTKCEVCRRSLFSENPRGREIDRFIDGMNRGGLSYSSQSLYDLISTLEKRTVTVLYESTLNLDSFFNILEGMDELEFIPLVGCKEHTHHLTGAIIRFFAVTRMHFACKIANRAENRQQERTRLHRKWAKLQ